MKHFYLICFILFSSLSFCQTKSAETSSNATTTDVVIYPNPVRSDLHVNLKRNTIFKIAIYTMLGNKVLEQSVLNKTPINVTPLKKGVYIIKIFVDDQVISKRFIKN